ncbi:aromatic acid exporter family member 1 [Rathayibacter tanaceti]|uniref:Aromatic acid exporter family member 1 n=2 Tax=Rathayibacter tanaceti TaxID=1671680 RepID=A0ACD2XKA4_9MICO|nr:FUSC family protein [Rathayibacter tanaceti]QHC54603.1 FUSC family protein [Rathayibacter tanaceti]TCO37597.1 aromatic acid exporter family member 1 [Rathayibacter tanaceti]
MRLTSSFTVPSRPPVLQLVKTAAATVVTWLLAALIFPGTLPVFGAIAALLVVAPSVNQSFSKAMERSVGVIIGVIVGSVIGTVLGGDSLIVLLAIVAAIAVGWVVRLTPASAVQIPISAMLVLSVGAVTPNYALDRILETLVGAAVGVVVNIAIVPPVALAPAERAVGDLTAQLAAGLDDLADALQSPVPRRRLDEMLINARLLQTMQRKAEEAIATGEESLRFNPRRSGHRDRLLALDSVMPRLGRIVTRVRGMTRTVHDLYDDELVGEPTIADIAVQLHRAAHDLRLLVQTSVAVPEPEAITDELPALTAPLVIVAPHPEHWILLGALAEDLRRIREEILGEES